MTRTSEVKCRDGAALAAARVVVRHELGIYIHIYICMNASAHNATTYGSNSILLAE